MHGMRIGLDMHVVDGLHQGSRVHCLELFSRVVALLPQCRFFCFLETPEYLQKHWPAFNAPNVSLVRMPHQSAPRRLLFQLPGLARQYKLHLLHTQYIIPLALPCAAAVTIHDILYEKYPQFFARIFRLRSRLLVRRSARRAALIFTVSDYSRHAIASTYGVPLERIQILSNGVSRERFHPGVENADTAELSPYGLAAGEYLLSVGRLEPRKNHLRLIEAYSQLPQLRPKLVIIGQRDFGFEAFLAAIDRLQLGKDLLLLEDVQDDLLPHFYRNARLFLYPSLAEGFGMPVLEAMASGVPVVTSNTTALPEVAGGAAYLCDPSDTASIAGAIREALTDPDRNGKILTGLERARALHWNHAAENLAQAYLEFFEHL